MASIRFASADGTTADPTAAAIRSGQVPAASANSTWFLNRISDYNRPPVSLRTPDAIERAAQQQAQMLAQIRRQQMEATQLAIQAGQVPQQATQPQMTAGQQAETARLQAQVPQQAEQQEPLNLFGAPLSGPLGRAVTSLARDPFGWLTQEAPNFEVRTDPMGNPLRPQAPMRPGVSPTQGPDRPGYIQRPVMDGNGNIIGYEYEKLMNVSTPTMEEVEAAAQPGANQVTSRQTGYISIYDEISALENSFSNRKTKVAEEAWGKPVEVENPDKSTTLKWGTNGMEYLGLEPGQIVAPTPKRPDPDAPYSEWVKYRDRLQRQIRVPLYTPQSLDNEFNNMGISGIRDFQRAALAARLYDTNDVVTLGNVSMKDYQIMQGLMEKANLNGTTWKDQLSLYTQAAATMPASGRGGGGGGGGGGGTSVTTQITYNQTSMAQARTILTAVLQEALGRRPSEQELADFIAMLNEAESKDPTKTVTRTTATGDRTRVVSRTTPGAVDAQQMAQEFAEGIEGGAPFRENRAQTYMNWIAERLGYGFGQG